jgi:hypothetical protein
MVRGLWNRCENLQTDCIANIKTRDKRIFVAIVFLIVHIQFAGGKVAFLELVLCELPGFHNILRA